MESTSRPTEAPSGKRGSTVPAAAGEPLADLISLEAVVSVLIKKGVVTAEDLYQEEARLRAEQDETETTHVVSIPSNSRSKKHDSGSSHGSRRQSQSWLKRQMSKRRWTRRLGTLLFGWQWKKVKRSRKKPTAAAVPEGED